MDKKENITESVINDFINRHIQLTKYVNMDNNIDINADTDKYFPILIKVSYSTIIKNLLEHGLNKQVIIKHLDIVCEYGHILIIEYLLKDELSIEKFYDFSIYYICLHGYENIFDLLIKENLDLQEIQDYRICLEVACCSGNINMVRIMIEQGYTDEDEVYYRETEGYLCMDARDSNRPNIIKEDNELYAIRHAYETNNFKIFNALIWEYNIYEIINEVYEDNNLKVFDSIIKHCRHSLFRNMPESRELVWLSSIITNMCLGNLPGALEILEKYGIKLIKSKVDLYKEKDYFDKYVLFPIGNSMGSIYYIACYPYMLCIITFLPKYENLNTPKNLIHGLLSQKNKPYLNKLFEVVVFGIREGNDHHCIVRFLLRNIYTKQDLLPFLNYIFNKPLMRIMDYELKQIIEFAYINNSIDIMDILQKNISVEYAIVNLMSY